MAGITNLFIKILIVLFVSAASLQNADTKPIELYIANRPTNLEIGSSFTLQCRLRHWTGSSRLFNLRWLRLLDGSAENQTITETDIDSSPNTIIAATTRIWSVRRDNGLDLEVNNFQAADFGTYHCQAVSSAGEPFSPADEISIQLLSSHAENTAASDEPVDANNSSSWFDSWQLYSQENLSKLLPSLKIIVQPPFNWEVPLGENLQLACVTSDLDPDPEPDQLEWTFEPMAQNRLELLERSPQRARQLPYNTTALGNVLVIWSMLEEHSGIYKCTYRMEEFNLTSETSVELHAMGSQQLYSAPLVTVRPELVRLSVNGSASIRCETTGYPPPEIIWYRVNELATSQSKQSELLINGSTSPSGAGQMSIFESHIEGILVEQIGFGHLGAYCRLNRCQAEGGDSNQRLRLTGMSTIHLHEVKASHQGQYVCQASNRHGSNQATSIVDVEIKEAPAVEIAASDSRQIIQLPGDHLALGSSSSSEAEQNVTFRCSATAGRPRPRLRWLRAGPFRPTTNLIEDDNLDLYDLTKVSSATTKVRTISEDSGNSLSLVIGTISLDDEGEYVCLAENEAGRQSAVARLIVQKPASIRILQASPHVAKLNDSFHLDCLVSGHPLPVDIEWSRTDRGSFFSLISRTATGDGQERALLKFDRVTQDEVGEYTCNARDPLEPGNVLRDTIMVVVGEEADSSSSTAGAKQAEATSSGPSLQVPKLMIRPTKLNAPIGSNVTLDCLAVSGLQPTLVEWQAPSGHLSASSSSIQSYYRGGQDQQQLLQFGSKLRILNVSKAHEGIYQCKGKNKVGTEVAPALIKVLDPAAVPTELEQSAPAPPLSNQPDGSGQATRTKVAKFGSNIELKCQVNGVEQPATSWSRDGQELPRSSVQIGHNLWIQNVSSGDNGLYVCSARSREPNRIIQAKINLLVSENLAAGLQSRRFKNLDARIVASKSQLARGDSVTLECIISLVTNDTTQYHISQEDLEEIERNVVWTNLHSGQSLFQDNVYILNNLLIIYDLKWENSATYRCSYNTDLSQHTDYLLQVTPQDSSSSPTNVTQLTNSSIDQKQRSPIEIKQVAAGSRLTLECNSQDFFPHWTRGAAAHRIPLNNRANNAGDRRALIFESITTRDADLYSCQSRGGESQHYLVNVLLPVARFTQAPVSFVTLPTIAGANQQQLEIEVKFLPETDRGLLLFSSQRQQQQQRDGDYLTLGLVEGGYLEFKFELGDGMTTLKSLAPVSLNQWHRVMIERNRRGAVMWLDDQSAVSNSSSGNFFNLNLDSVLYVGGHQQFLYSAGGQSTVHGYSSGFQGCVSLLRISRQEINLMARNRSVAVGIFECHKPECSDEKFCSSPLNGLCQVDRSKYERRWEPATSGGGQMSAQADLRCVCAPAFAGRNCSEAISAAPQISKCNESTSTNTCPASSQCKGNCSTVAHGGEDEHAAQFNQQSYLRLAFNKAATYEEFLRNNQQTSKNITNELMNATSYAKQIAMGDQQNISLTFQTNSSFGILFYFGQLTFDSPPADNPTPLDNKREPARKAPKSPVVSLMSRLSRQQVSDYLVIALIDGQLEVSFELGSGVGLLRSSKSLRLNDGARHSIQVVRVGKLAKLIVDQANKYETSSPGRLSALNSDNDDLYLGGLPFVRHQLFSQFAGCISQVEINSLGPLNLVRSNHLAQVRGAQNLSPCAGSKQQPLQPQTATKHKPYTSPPIENEDKEPDELAAAAKRR